MQLTSDAARKGASEDPMSTRSTTHFLNAATAQPTAIIYRHSDGYPEGAGADLLAFLERVSGLRTGRFNDPAYLSAKYVVYLAEMFATYDSKTPNADRLDFLSVGVLSQDPGDIEYRYVVICDGKGNGRPTVKCFKVGRNAEYDLDASTDVEIDLTAELAKKG